MFCRSEAWNLFPNNSCPTCLNLWKLIDLLEYSEKYLNASFEDLNFKAIKSINSLVCSDFQSKDPNSPIKSF